MPIKIRVIFIPGKSIKEIGLVNVILNKTNIAKVNAFAHLVQKSPLAVNSRVHAKTQRREGICYFRLPLPFLSSFTIPDFPLPFPLSFVIPISLLSFRRRPESLRTGPYPKMVVKSYALLHADPV